MNTGNTTMSSKTYKDLNMELFVSRPHHRIAQKQISERQWWNEAGRALSLTLIIPTL